MPGGRQARTNMAADSSSSCIWTNWRSRLRWPSRQALASRSGGASSTTSISGSAMAATIPRLAGTAEAANARTITAILPASIPGFAVG
jgi:hypothetical protein